jgi:hypothetical protein
VALLPYFQSSLPDLNKLQTIWMSILNPFLSNGQQQQSSNFPAYYSGYMATGETWSTTSASFVDPTNTGGNVLTPRISSGIFVSAAAALLPGLTFTPASFTAAYLVTAIFQLNCNTTGDSAVSRLYDGKNVVSTGSMTIYGAAGAKGYIPTTLSGIWKPNTNVPSTIKIQLASAGGTSMIGDGSGLASAIDWSVIQITS